MQLRLGTNLGTALGTTVFVMCSDRSSMGFMVSPTAMMYATAVP